MSPVGVPPVEVIFAVKVTVEPGAASAGAARVNNVASAVTCRGILSLLGKKTPSPLYCAVIAWIPTSVRIASKVAEPFVNGAVPNRLEPSKNVTVPVGAPGLSSAAATVAVIVALVLVGVSGADTRVRLTRPVIIAPNSPSSEFWNSEVKYSVFGSPNPSDRKARP